MKPYPIFLIGLENRHCVVIGGGHEAEFKVKGLLDVDAQVTVISPTLTATLQAWADEACFTWVRRAYRSGDLRGAWLVIAERGEAAVNAAIHAEAEAEKALVTVMDAIGQSNAVAGSVVRQGLLTLVISTSGAAPALAVRLRERFEQEFGPEYALWLDWLHQLRAPMQHAHPRFGDRKAVWYRLIDSEALALIRDGQTEAALALVEAISGIRLDPGAAAAAVVKRRGAYAHPEVLVSAEWLADHLDDPSVRLIEVSVDADAYAGGHLPGAVGWNWQVDTQDPITRDIPRREAFEQLVGQAGISNDTTVVLYGDHNNWFAAYAFWLFKIYGHADVRLLDGGRTRWTAAGYPLTMDVPSYAATTYAAQPPDGAQRALRPRVEESLGAADSVLIDTRSPAEFAGDLVAPVHLAQEGALRGGHIPGAVNIPWGRAVGADGCFESADTLADLYLAAGVTPDKHVITYCRIGERSAHTWFVLRYLLGYPDVRNYDGSWAEWGNLIGAPIARGN